ncbi:MAG TPA: mercury methylation ferredoxin HgcB [Myxococcota bacterium]|nr:mercury methylation ferredoxin HgcB [Myxococcota bacterium]HQK51727.1 mercury methylation ferredoxin HgcB [Myxococcota bacterium]
MRYIEGVVTLQFDPEKCNGCTRCTQVCPHGVFGFENKRAILVDRGACIECGACARNCEPGAIQVRSGVGCAAGVLAGLLAGTGPTCDCSGSDASSCC